MVLESAHHLRIISTLYKIKICVCQTNWYLTEHMNPPAEPNKHSKLPNKNRKPEEINTLGHREAVSSR